MTRKTTIDIGTNTILMLIADYDTANKSVNTILDIQRVPRLGKGVDANRNILPGSLKKAVDILNEYKKISLEYGSGNITASATSFIRDAVNRDEFIYAINKETGITIEVLSGDDEAKWTFTGGIYDKAGAAGGKITTIDIGGGSTEITTADINPASFKSNNFSEIQFEGKSLNIGSVRINEKFLSSHPPRYESIVKAEEFIYEHFKQVDFDLTQSRLIGVAGTITTLGAIKLGANTFNAADVDNMEISFEDAESILNRLAPLSLEELYSMGDYMTGRADIIIPGILILKCFMAKFGFRKLRVTTKGLRYGIFLREVLQ